MFPQGGKHEELKLQEAPHRADTARNPHFPHGGGRAVGSSIATAADEIRIGFTTAVTGVLAAMAAPERKAIQFALKQINAAGGVNGKKINLIVVDAQSTIPGALAAVQKAVDQE